MTNTANPNPVPEDSDSFGKPPLGNPAAAEDASKGEADTKTLKGVDDILNMDPAAMAAMSPQDMEKAMGLENHDRSLIDGKSTDKTVAEIERGLADGSLTNATEADVAGAAGASDQEKAAAEATAKAEAEAAATKKAADDAAAAAEAAKKGTNADPEFVESRDGKGKIPYSVLEAARASAATALAELATERAKNAATAETEAAAKAQAEAAAAAAKGLLSPEKIAELRETLPDSLVDILVAQNNTIIDLSGKVAKPAATSKVDDAAQRSQDLIDQDPVLSAWQNDPDAKLWNRACAFDEVLVKDPEWSKKPDSERFAEVKRLMGVAPEKTADPAQVAAAAQAAADAAAKAATAAALKDKPFTHSDMPGGNAAAQSEVESVAQMDPMQLEKKIQAMSPEQLSAYLAKVG